MIYRAAVLVWLLLGALTAHALDASKSIESYSRRSWFTDDGLPHNTIHDLVQDPRGYIWLSTWDGVARFNGRDFRIYNRRNTPQMQDDGIRALAVDRNGSLYAASAQGGLMRFANEQWATLPMDAGVSPRLTVLLIDSQGRLWTGSQDLGLATLEGGKLHSFTGNGELLHPWVLALAEDRERRLWVGTARGLHRISGDRVEHFGPEQGLPVAIVFALAQDRAGVLWVGTDRGLFRSDRGHFVEVDLGTHAGAAISAILEDRDGNLWFGTQSAGLLRLRDGVVESLGASQGLSNNRVLRLFEDREGGLWVATNAGLNRLRDSAFQAYTRREGLADDFVRSVHQGATGTVWIGTSEGVSRFDAGQLIPEARVPAGTSVMSVLEDRAGVLWVGTYDRGLIELGKDYVKRWTQADGLAFDQVRALFEAADGSLWVGTAGGATQIRAGKVVANYNQASGLPESYVLAIYETPDGRTWFGTVNGFAVLGPEGLRAYRRADGFPAEDVFDFHQDDLGTLWIGSDGGLIRWRDGKFRAFGEADGLADEVIFRVLDDRQGSFWLTSNSGLMQVDQAQLEGLDDAPGKRLQVRGYGRQDGMASSQCNGGSQPSGWRDSHGSLWLPTARGVTVLDPGARRRVREVYSPRVVIEEFRVDGELADTGNTALMLDPGKRKFAFRYAGLSYNEPEKLRYRYRLIGFDREWVEAAALQEATYTNLGPGDYAFEVVAATSDGIYSELPDSFRFSLRPFFWQTPWFIALAGLALVVSGALVPWLRAGQLRARERKLSLLVAQRTEELRAQNLALEQANDEKSRLVDTVSRQAAAFARQAQEDALTGLPNRRRFRELLELAAQSAQTTGTPLAIGLADLDHFKGVNDRYGHEVGDRVLIAAASAMRKALGERGTLARYGGEEFAMFMQGRKAATCVELAHDLLRAIQDVRVEGLPVDHGLSVSIGLSTLREGTFDAALRRADDQLYRAKHLGRARIEIDDRPGVDPHDRT